MRSTALTIVGVTGLINLQNYTTYNILQSYNNVDYLQFQAWVLIWSAIMHFIVAIFNISDYTRFITFVQNPLRSPLTRL